jgi:hypothetical protein
MARVCAVCVLNINDHRSLFADKVIESISSNEEFLQRLSVSCTAEDHAGVKGNVYC